MDVIVLAVEQSTSHRCAPHRENVTEALRRLNERSNATSGRGVILPPRITRLISGSGTTTSVAFLVRGPLPSGMTEQQRINEITTAVRSALNDIGDCTGLWDTRVNWVSVTGSVHNPTINGPIEFWTSGDASFTQTRDNASVWSVEYAENPIGPNDARLRERTVPGEVGRGITVGKQDITDVLYAAAFIAVPVAAAWGANSVYKIYRTSKARGNPSRRSLKWL